MWPFLWHCRYTWQKISKELILFNRETWRLFECVFHCGRREEGLKVFAEASPTPWQLIELTTTWRALSSTSAPDRIWSGAAICLIINLRASATLILSPFPFINHYGPAIALMGDGSADWTQPRHSGRNTHLGPRAGQVIRTEETGPVPVHLGCCRLLAVKHEDGDTHLLIKISVTHVHTKYLVIFCVSRISISKEICPVDSIMDANGHLSVVCGWYAPIIWPVY